MLGPGVDVKRRWNLVAGAQFSERTKCRAESIRVIKQGMELSIQNVKVRKCCNTCVVLLVPILKSIHNKTNWLNKPLVFITVMDLVEYFTDGKPCFWGSMLGIWWCFEIWILCLRYTRSGKIGITAIKAIYALLVVLRENERLFISE